MDCQIARRATTPLRDARGVATIAAVVGLVLFLVLAATFVGFAQLEMQIGVNHAKEVDAVQAAEAGARRTFREMTLAPAPPNTWLALSQPIHNAVLVHGPGSATYTVNIVDNNDGDGDASVDSDNVVAIRSRGASAAGGAQRTVALMVSTGPFVPRDAVLVKNALTVNGNPAILGRCGSVHVPVDSGYVGGGVNIGSPGNAVIQQGASTSGSSVSGDYYYAATATGPQVPPETAVAIHPVPAITSEQFGQYADYLLLDNGWAYAWTPTAVNPNTISPCTTAPCNTPDPPGWTRHISDPLNPTKNTKDSGKCSFGWKMDAEVSSSGHARWTLCGAGENGFQTPGTFYVMGRTVMSQNVGAVGNPYRVTVLAIGHIEVSGNPQIRWDNGVGPNTAFPFASHTQFVSGRDVKINGNPDQSFEGLVAAREQLAISGNPSILGFFIAENQNPNISSWPTGDGLVTASHISGNPTITFDCTATVPTLTTPPTVLGWLEE